MLTIWNQFAYYKCPQAPTECILPSLSLSLTLALLGPKTQSANMQICKFTPTHAQQIWNVDLNASENAHLIKSALLRLLFEYYFIMSPAAARQQAHRRAEQLALSAVRCPLSVLIWQIQTEHSLSRSRRHSSARSARNICTKTHYFN